MAFTIQQPAFPWLCLRYMFWSNCEMHYIDQILGVVIGSLTSARFGRRMCMFVMSIYALGTATICVTAQSRDQILAGRILNCKFLWPGFISMQ